MTDEELKVRIAKAKKAHEAGMDEFEAIKKYVGSIGIEIPKGDLEKYPFLR